MGISIHYTGQIADKRKLPQLIEEVQEIALVNHWKYHIYETKFPDEAYETDVDDKHNGKLYGIDFTPQGSEPVSVCFLSNGVISSIMQMACWGDNEIEHTFTTESITWDENGNEVTSIENTIIDKDESYKMLCSCFTKTQYAGPATHELIIGVLRYVAKTYLTDFKLSDESQFWETGDRELMIRNFKRTGFLIDSFGATLNNESQFPDEDIESFIKRIANRIQKKNFDSADDIHQ